MMAMMSFMEEARGQRSEVRAEVADSDPDLKQAHSMVNVLEPQPIL
jgi:hypothetical protein